MKLLMLALCFGPPLVHANLLVLESIDNAQPRVDEAALQRWHVGKVRKSHTRPGFSIGRDGQ